MSTHTVHALTIDILDGDIAAQRVDAVVNAANNALWMGSGVAGALKARGGAAIEQEAMRQGPIEPGQAVVTTGGKLPARHVIHAAVMGQDLRTDERLIRRATGAALDEAERIGAASVAFPALGTGVGGFPLDECARVMLETVKSRAAALKSIRRIVFVLYGQTAFDAFDRVAVEVLPA